MASKPKSDAMSLEHSLATDNIKQRYNLPPIKIRSAHGNWFHPTTDAAGIGFDGSTNTFKTVSVILKEPVRSRDIGAVRAQLCTLVHRPGMMSWAKIPQIPAYPIRGAGVFAHGRLHWLVSSEWWSYNEGTKVVWFDLKTEEFGLTNPPKREQGYWANDKLVDLNSEVGLAYNDNDHVELWALKQQEWVLHCRLDLRPKSYNNRVAISGCWSKNGDILLTSDKGRKLFVYTLKTGVLRRVKWRDRFEADVQMYQTSLVSIHAMSAYLGEKVSMRRRRKRKV
ncbi:hypothetical protein R6Q59_007865 [Mikania micrantha]